MIEVVGGVVLCGRCRAKTTKEAGYYLCHECGWRFYGDPNTDPYDRDGCYRCGTVYLKCLKQCPSCGLLRD